MTMYRQPLLAFVLLDEKHQRGRFGGEMTQNPR